MHAHTAGEEEGGDYHPDEADPQGMMSARNSFVGHVPADHYMTHDQLKALAESMKHSVDIRDRRFHLTKYKKVHCSCMCAHSTFMPVCVM
jgi:transposase